MDWFSGWCKSKRRLDGCTAIVTGCNTGIGKETASDLFARGARVIMACRDTDRTNLAKSEIQKQKEKNPETGVLIVEQLDLSSQRSIRRFAARVLDTEEQIHLLINNAGVMCCPEGKTEDGFETHVGTNHFGHALLTLLLLPRLIKSPPARVVCVSSYLHEKHNLDLDDLNFEKSPYDPMKAYCRSKAANVLFAKSLALKLKEHKIDQVTTYSLHPGIIRTDIGRHFSTTVWYGATWAFNYIMGPFLKSIKCGAQTTIYCAVDEACAHESGLYYSDCAVKSPAKQCQNEDFALKFWERTIAALNLVDYNPFSTADPPKNLLE